MSKLPVLLEKVKELADYRIELLDLYYKGKLERTVTHYMKEKAKEIGGISLATFYAYQRRQGGDRRKTPRGPDRRRNLE